MAVLQCRKTVHTDEGKQRQAALLAFSAFPELKHVILVDEDVDIFDPSDVLWAMNTRFQRAPFLDVNPEKWLCQKGTDPMSEGQATCPMCENHCPVTELRCGKGRAHFGLTNSAGDHPCDGGHHHGHEHDHGHHRGGYL